MRIMVATRGRLPGMPLRKEWPVPVLYLDLDGTVRWGKDELGRFVHTAGDVRVFDEVPNLMARYKEAGWRIAGVSNQGGIALGLLSMEDCVGALTETLRQTGDRFDKVLVCPHHPDATDPMLATCWCRKPRPGMILDAAWTMAGEHPGEIYPPHLALMVGDRLEDEEAAIGANVSFMRAKDWRAGAHVLSARDPLISGAP